MHIVRQSIIWYLPTFLLFHYFIVYTLPVLAVRFFSCFFAPQFCIRKPRWRQACLLPGFISCHMTLVYEAWLRSACTLDNLGIPTVQYTTAVHTLCHACASAMHTLCHAYTLSCIHSAVHTLCHAYTLPCKHSAVHTLCRAYKLPCIHSAVHTLCRAYTLPFPPAMRLFHAFCRALCHAFHPCTITCFPATQSCQKNCKYNVLSLATISTAGAARIHI